MRYTKKCRTKCQGQRTQKEQGLTLRGITPALHLTWGSVFPLSPQSSSSTSNGTISSSGGTVAVAPVTSLFRKMIPSGGKVSEIE